MSDSLVSKLSNTFSTGGGGTNFEQEIQAMFLLSLLIEGFCPAMNRQTKRVCFQAKRLGFDVDDLAVFTDCGEYEGKLLCQIKHSITATKNNKIFKKIIYAAWCDINKDGFNEKRDKIALITAQISNKAQKSLRHLHAQATAAFDENDFIDRVSTPYFSNAEHMEMLSVIENCITEVKGGKAERKELWSFCKAFILLLVDMDCEESVIRALSSSLVKCNSFVDAGLAWSRLVLYAGRCNQTGASVERKSIDSEVQALFKVSKVIRRSPEPIKEIDLFIPMIALIGSWISDNEHDRYIIEKISGLTYSEFEAKARWMLTENEDYLQLLNGNSWNVLFKEDLLSQCKQLFFDDCLGRLFEAVKTVLVQKSKRVMNQTPYHLSSSEEFDNSYELRISLIKSVCWIKKSLPDLPMCNHAKVERAAAQLVKELLDDAEWTLWASMRDCLQYLAELSPDVYLDSVEKSILNTPQEILQLFPQKGIDLFLPSNYISELLWSLEILAWSPDYLVRVVSTLGLMEALPYDNLNWGNTPINSIVSILLPWYPQTLANTEKRKNALLCLKNDNEDIFWTVLKKLLPNQTMSTIDNPRPQYTLLDIPDKITVSNADVHNYYAYLLELAVEVACNEQGKIIDLVDQIEYMHEPTLSLFLTCIEHNRELFSDRYSFELWLKFRERMALIKATEEHVIYKQLSRINLLINSLEPKDKRLRYQELYIGNRCLLGLDKNENKWEILEKKRQDAVKEIFDQYGIEETEKYGLSVNNLQDVGYKLGQTLNQYNISLVIHAYTCKKVSKQFSAAIITGFVYSNEPIELLDTSLKKIGKEEALDLLAQIPFTLQIFKVIEAILDNTAAYWKIAKMPYVCEDENELKLIVKNLNYCRRYITAVNIVGRSKYESAFSADCICNLLKTAGTEKSIGNELFDNYAVRNLISWVQDQKDLDLEVRSDIEFIYLPLLDGSSDVHPNALFMRISLCPEYFCSLIELFFKKKAATEFEGTINKGLTDRLCEILLQFKVVPGIDENGYFDENIFNEWMLYVKKWSKANDRFEVTMHTVGSGLSYACLDEGKMPPLAIIKELNRAENKELRRGYFLGIINQRGMHFVDPEGKAEMKLAQEYKYRASVAEEKGYARYADVLNKIAEAYSNEAKSNIIGATKKH